MSRIGFLFLPSWVAPVTYAAAVVAMALAWRRLLPLLSSARAPAQPGAAGQLLRLALLQARVLRTPAGVAHALMFWGFLALLAATLVVNLDWWALRPLGLRLLEGRLYVAFTGVVEVGGLLLTSGAALSLLSRGRSARQRGVLGLLLFLGLSGFALETIHLFLYPESGARPLGSWLAAHAADVVPPMALARGYFPLWALHVAAALGLIALAADRVLLHATAAPLRLVAAGERPPAACPTPFDLRELLAEGRFDVAVGARTVGDLDPALRLGLLACTECGRCDEACPAGDVLRPRAVVVALRGEEVAHSVRPLQEIVPDEAVWACTTCAACAQACPVLITPQLYLLEMRRAAIADFRVPPAAADVLARLERHGNPYGVTPEARAKVLARLGLPTLEHEPSADWLYWLGCSAACDGRVQQVVAAVVRLLRAAGVRVAALAEGECCSGEGARRLGEEGRFQQLAMANAERLSALGVKRIVSHCAHCCNTLREEYQRFGWAGEVAHHTELLAALQAEGKLPLRRVDAAPVVLHDACYQARYAAQTAAPRALLAAAGAPLVEAAARGASTRCCGGGGGAFAQGTPLGRQMAARRMADLGDRAGTIAVECPFCLKMLAEAAVAGVRVRDVAEILADAIDKEPPCPS